jgi:holo-[acyl-carrier protein] synthase
MIIGIGTDHVEVDEFKPRVKNASSKFARRVFTKSELAYANDTDDFVQRLAARFAAKEAVLKALGTGWTDETEWQDIEILNTKSGQPKATLRGKTARLAASLKVKRVFVSISHTRHLATAQVVLEGLGR